MLNLILKLVKNKFFVKYIGEHKKVGGVMLRMLKKR